MAVLASLSEKKKTKEASQAPENEVKEAKEENPPKRTKLPEAPLTG